MRRLFVLLIPAALLALAVAATPAMAKQGKSKGKGGGYVYTETNDTTKNQIIVFKRSPAGKLTEKTRVDSGGAGAASYPPFGFRIVDTQGAVELTDNGRVLFAVNGGDDSISSFRVGRNGSLKLVDTKSSGGDLPVSLDSQKNLMYVTNSATGNISGFKWKNNGHFSAIPNSTQSLSTSGPGGVVAQVGFAPKKYRTVTATLRGTNSIDTFKLDSNGAAQAVHANASADDNPFGFEYRRDGVLVLSNAGTGGSAADVGDPTKFNSRAASYNLGTNGATTLINSIGLTNNGAPERASCWTVLTRNGKYAFMTNTLSNTVSRLSVSSNGTLTQIGSVPTAGQAGAPPFASDEALSKGSKFLYVLSPTAAPGTPDASLIDAYRVGPGGTLTHIQTTPATLPSGVSGLAAK